MTRSEINTRVKKTKNIWVLNSTYCKWCMCHAICTLDISGKQIELRSKSLKIWPSGFQQQQNLFQVFTLLRWQSGCCSPQTWTSYSGRAQSRAGDLSVCRWRAGEQWMGAGRAPDYGGRMGHLLNLRKGLLWLLWCDLEYGSQRFLSGGLL